MSSGATAWQVLTVVTDNPDLIETALMWAIPAYISLWGLGAVKGSWSGWRRARRIEDTATETARGASMGRTEITGTVEPAGETLTQPLADEECVYARWAAKRGHIATMNAQGETTAVVGAPDIDEQAVPFYVDDGTGKVLVDVDDDPTVELHDDSITNTTVSDAASRDDRIGEFVREQYPEGSKKRTSDHLSLRQDVVEPGDDVYVYGGATEESDGNVVIGRDAESGRFLISDQPEEALTEGVQTATGGGPLGLKIGAGLLVVGFFWLLVAAAGLRFTMPVLVAGGLVTQAAAWAGVALE